MLGDFRKRENNDIRSDGLQSGSDADGVNERKVSLWLQIGIDFTNL